MRQNPASTTASSSEPSDDWLSPDDQGLSLDELSQAYAALDCVVLLLLGVLLLTRAEGRRVPLLLMAGFATMFLADILWSRPPYRHRGGKSVAPEAAHRA